MTAIFTKVSYMLKHTWFGRTDFYAVQSDVDSQNMSTSLWGEILGNSSQLRDKRISRQEKEAIRRRLEKAGSTHQLYGSMAGD